jgi:CelD/BcsL family acetyltransferase involved in cellulose biosynthesis
VDTELSSAHLVVQRLTNSSELETLRAEWTSLIDEIPAASIFSSWEWINTWWKHYEDSGHLWLLTFRDQEDKLVGIVPWVLKGPGGLFGVRQLSFLFNSPPVHLDIIARPQDQSAVCTALIDHLHALRNEWDLLDLRGLAEASCLKEVLTSQPGHFQVREGLTCTYITLPSDWETFEKKSLSANRRKQIRSNQRRLERDYPDQVTFRRIDDPADIQTALDVLIQFNRDKWQSRDGVSAFEDVRFRRFNHEMASVAAALGWLRFYELRVAGELLASRLCYSYRGIIFDFQTAYNPQWSDYSPGELLLVYALKDAIQEGAAEFDFLPGTYRWKMSWSTGARQESHIVFGHNWRCISALASASFLDRAIVIGRKILPYSKRERLNLLISRLKQRGTMQKSHDANRTK